MGHEWIFWFPPSLEGGGWGEGGLVGGGCLPVPFAPIVPFTPIVALPLRGEGLISWG